MADNIFFMCYILSVAYLYVHAFVNLDFQGVEVDRKNSDIKEFPKKKSEEEEIEFYVEEDSNEDLDESNADDDM